MKLQTSSEKTDEKSKGKIKELTEILKQKEQQEEIVEVYTLEELESVIKYIAEGNVRNIYSPGYLSYATNKILDEIRLKEVKSKDNTSTLGIKVFNVDREVKPKKSSFLDKFI